MVECLPLKRKRKLKVCYRNWFRTNCSGGYCVPDPLVTSVHNCWPGWRKIFHTFSFFPSRKPRKHSCLEKIHVFTGKHCVLYSKLFLVKGQYPFSLTLAALKDCMYWSSSNYFWGSFPFWLLFSHTPFLFLWKIQHILRVAQYSSLNFFPLALFYVIFYSVASFGTM